MVRSGKMTAPYEGRSAFTFELGGHNPHQRSAKRHRALAQLWAFSFSPVPGLRSIGWDRHAPLAMTKWKANCAVWEDGRTLQRIFLFRSADFSLRCHSPFTNHHAQYWDCHDDVGS